MYKYIVTLLLCASSLSYGQNAVSFDQRLEQLKPQVKETIIENIKQFWTVKTVQNMRAQGYAEKDIETLILGSSFQFFLKQVVNDPKTQKSLDTYINATLNEKKLLERIKILDQQRKEKELEQYKEVLRMIAQMRKEQDYEIKEKPWYHRFFKDFKLF